MNRQNENLPADYEARQGRISKPVFTKDVILARLNEMSKPREHPENNFAELFYAICEGLTELAVALFLFIPFGMFLILAYLVLYG